MKTFANEEKLLFHFFSSIELFRSVDFFLLFFFAHFALSLFPSSHLFLRLNDFYWKIWNNSHRLNKNKIVTLCWSEKNNERTVKNALCMFKCTEYFFSLFLCWFVVSRFFFLFFLLLLTTDSRCVYRSAKSINTSRRFYFFFYLFSLFVIIYFGIFIFCVCFFCSLLVVVLRLLVYFI